MTPSGPLDDVTGEPGSGLRPLARLRWVLQARSGASATALTLASSVAILGLNLGTGVISARLLGPGGRGELAAIVMWPQFLAFMLTLGLPSSLLYNLRCYEDKGRQLFSVALLAGTIMGGVAIAVGVLLIPYRLVSYSPELVRFAQLAMVTAPVALMFVVLNSALLARHEFFLYNFTRVLSPLIALIAMLGLIAAGGLSPHTAAIATLAAAVPIVGWMVLRFWWLYPPTTKGLRWASQRLISYGLRGYGADLLGTLTEQIDKVVVVGLLDPAMMGIYVVAVSFAQMLNVFPTAVVPVLFPKSSGRSTDEVVAVTGRAARLNGISSVLAGAVVALLAPWIVGRVFGADYLGAVPVLRILLLEGVLRGTIWILVQAFMALDKPGLVSALQGAGLCVTVPLLLALVPRYGLLGAGSALLLATTTRLVLVLACFPLILRTSPPSLRPRWGEVDLLIRQAQSMDR
ncbi:MAG TPA: oligosaccharide flippase family protein [Patescibacteria group bacterium]|jgi:O-antigen/teichoic acid export membrane protein|nr:oligosaccharide flippase family protein [Patescibacteria group bacterium]